jgi:uncharacterized protein YbaP (TraB family)
VGAAVMALLVATMSAQGASRNFLWKATKGGSTMYLVGSVHLLAKDYYPLNPALEAAFKDSDRLVEEVDLGEMMATENQLSMLMEGMLPAGQSLENVISKQTFDVVSKRLEGLGMPVEPLKRMKPWLLAITLLGMEWQKAGFEAELGLDKHFYDLARSAKKPVEGLETVRFQISQFDGMTNDEQERLLAETIKELDTQQAEVTRLADAWKAGDVATVERIVLQDLKSERRLYDRMLVERNKNWVPKIEAIVAKGGRPFIVVGAAHLVGSDGLIAMLRARGYAVEQL